MRAPRSWSSRAYAREPKRRIVRSLCHPISLGPVVGQELAQQSLEEMFGPCEGWFLTKRCGNLSFSVLVVTVIGQPFWHFIRGSVDYYDRYMGEALVHHIKKLKP